MHSFPHLVNGPINEQQLLGVSGQLIEQGLPDNASSSQIRQFNILQRRHVALQSLVDAYKDNRRSVLACLLVGRYYANLERAIGTYRSVSILARSA